MRNNFQACGIAMFTVILILSGCAGGGMVQDVSYGTDGWIDSDTYRIAAVGVPNHRITDIEDKRMSAKRAAILNAQYMISERFKISGRADPHAATH